MYRKIFIELLKEDYFLIDEVVQESNQSYTLDQDVCYIIAISTFNKNLNCELYTYNDTLNVSIINDLIFFSQLRTINGLPDNTKLKETKAYKMCYCELYKKND